MESYGFKLHETMGCIANYESPCSCEENLNSSIVDVGWICTSCKDGEDNSSTMTEYPHALNQINRDQERVHHKTLNLELNLGLAVCNRKVLSKGHIMPTYHKGNFFSGSTYSEDRISIDSENVECIFDIEQEVEAPRKNLEIIQCHSQRFEIVSEDFIKSDSCCDEINLELGLCGGSDFASNVPHLSISANISSDFVSNVPHLSMGTRNFPSKYEHVPIPDEGSTSSKLMKSTLNPMTKTATAATSMDVKENEAWHLDISSDNGHPELVKADVSYSGGRGEVGAKDLQPQRASKQCKFKGCSKGGRGASGLCIAHGGGRRCQKPNCNKGAEGRTMFCKAHGGGRRCHFLGCIKSAEGKTDFCIAHGGGRRCRHEGCGKAARDKSGLCIRHGGGKRCQQEGCPRSAEGLSGLCISHGGGRRCQHPECGKGAQGSTGFCKAHGGGRRCQYEGCTKGAEGSTSFCKAHGGGKRCTYGGGMCTKSVHGGTLFCVAHGGGKRCSMIGCMKSARGRTNYCVRHGGGKRCKFEGCDKSAQGSTDFCKAHGGGKRCCWGQEGSSVYGGNVLGLPGLSGLKGSCDKFVRGEMGLCSTHNDLLEQFDMSRRNGSSDVRCESYTSSALLDQFDTCRHDLSNSGCGSYTSIALLHHCDTSMHDISNTRFGSFTSSNVLQKQQTAQFETIDQSIDMRSYATKSDIALVTGNNTSTQQFESPLHWIPSHDVGSTSNSHDLGRVVDKYSQGEDERISSCSKMVALAPTLPHLSPNSPVTFPFNSLEERVHGGSHVMVLLSDAATT